MRGRSITYKYKNFMYDNSINEKLSSIELSKNDEINIQNIKNYYESLGIDRGYKYIITDLYKFIVKLKMSTSDIANVYNLSPRTVQVWLKELGLNRSQKDAQKIAVKKRDYKAIRQTYKNNMIKQLVSNELDGPKLENFIRYNLNVALTEGLKEFEVIVGISALNILSGISNIPVIIIKESSVYKFIIIVNGEIDIEKRDLIGAKGYKLLNLTTRAYFLGENSEEINYKGDLEERLQHVLDGILEELN